MTLRDSTRTYQTELGELCRHGGPIPAAAGRSGGQRWQPDASRAAVYRRLVFGTIESTLSRAFPIAAATLGEERWQTLVHAFFSEYPSASPLLWQMPRGLVTYLSEHPERMPAELPFLFDLLRFEWIEIELAMMQDLRFGPPASTAALEDRARESIPLELNPHHAILELSYPVYLPLDDPRRHERGAHTLLAFRHPESLDVRFIRLSPMHRVVVELLRFGPSTGEEQREALKEAGIDYGEDALFELHRLFVERGAAVHLTPSIERAAEEETSDPDSTQYGPPTPTLPT